jgi:hypothetical protein
MPGKLFDRLLFKYANSMSDLLFRKKWRIFHVLFLDFCQTCPIPQFMQRHSTAVYIDFCNVLQQGTLHVPYEYDWKRICAKIPQF